MASVCVWVVEAKKSENAFVYFTVSKLSNCESSGILDSQFLYSLGGGG